MNRLKERYLKEIKPALIKKHGYTSSMEAPRLEKVVINLGVGEAVAEPKHLEDAVDCLKSRATDMGAMSIIITAYGKDGLREEEKAKEIADIGDAIAKLAKCRLEQVKNAMDYANKGEAGKELFAALGI